MDGGDKAPSWLSDTPAPATEPATEPATVSNVSLPTSDVESTSGLAPRPTLPPNPTALASTSADEDDKNLKSAIMSLRLFNLGMAAAMITHAVFVVVRIPAISHFVLSFYAGCSGCLICCLETQIKMIRTPIAVNFGFLFDPPLRFFFYLIMATLEWSFDDVFGKIVAGVIIACACYNTCIMFKFPKYRKKRDELAKEEDARIQSKIRGRVAKEAGKAATAQMFTGQ